MSAPAELGASNFWTIPDIGMLAWVPLVGEACLEILLFDYFLLQEAYCAAAG